MYTFYVFFKSTNWNPTIKRLNTQSIQITGQSFSFCPLISINPIICKALQSKSCLDKILSLVVTSCQRLRTCFLR